MCNDVWRGPVDLSENNFTDKGMLDLSRVFEKRNASNISALKLDDNKLGSKSGEFIGEVLSSNPDYDIEKLSFGKICLEEIGLTRVIEAVNTNKHIRKLNVGVLTDSGLVKLSELLAPNESLEEIKITETKDHQQYWTEAGRNAFLNMIRQFTQLRKVKVKFEHKETKEDELFEDEVKFHTKEKAEALSKGKDYEKRL